MTVTLSAQARGPREVATASVKSYGVDLWRTFGFFLFVFLQTREIRFPLQLLM